MALDVVPAEPAPDQQRPLEIHAVRRRALVEIRPLQRLRRAAYPEALRVELDHGQTGAIYCHAVPEGQSLTGRFRGDREAGLVAGGDEVADSTHLFDKTGEHRAEILSVELRRLSGVRVPILVYCL